MSSLSTTPKINSTTKYPIQNIKMQAEKVEDLSSNITLTTISSKPLVTIPTTDYEIQTSKTQTAKVENSLPNMLTKTNSSKPLDTNFTTISEIQNATIKVLKFCFTEKFQYNTQRVLNLAPIIDLAALIRALYV